MIYEILLAENIPYSVKQLPAKSILLRAGECAQHLFIVNSGAVRLFFNKDGREYTLQFILEKEPFCIYESLMREEPSEFSVETLEPTEILIFNRADVLQHLESNSLFKEAIMNYFIDKMVNYVHLFLSMQVLSPEQRYAELLRHCPDIIQRIPQHYIASFLGITPVSLSRIRGRAVQK